MACVLLPTAGEVRSAVEDEVRIAGGGVLESLAEDECLFLRSVLPRRCEVRPKDVLQGGVAVMVHGPMIRILPCTYRQVCRNGAIMAHTLGMREIERVPDYADAERVETVLGEVRETVRACASDEAFSAISKELAAAARTAADLAIQLLPMLSRMPRRERSRLAEQIRHWFQREGDRTVFGLMNAVTRTARDEPDPKVRWDLEELGGGIPALVRPRAKRGGAAARPCAQPSEAEPAVR